MSLPKTARMRSADGDVDVPTVGFGTWASGNNDWCYDATLSALRAGYKHIDCAWNYGVIFHSELRRPLPMVWLIVSQVDEAVGEAIRDSDVPRSELFITSKFWPQFGAPENAEKCLDLCLQNLGIDYLDLFLAHWPLALKARSNIASARAFPEATDAEKAIATSSDGKAIVDWTHTSQSIAVTNGQNGSFVPTWQAMQAMVATRKVRAVGVSNFNIGQLQEILSVGGVVPVSCNQVEAHPYFANTELLEFMQGQEILKTVFCPFAGQKKGGMPLVENPIVLRLAKKNDMGVGQLLQSWAVQRGTVPLGKSQTPGGWIQPFYIHTGPEWVTKRLAARIKANLSVRMLPQEDMDGLNGMDRGVHGRTVDLGPSWGVQFF